MLAVQQLAAVSQGLTSRQVCSRRVTGCRSRYSACGRALVEEQFFAEVGLARIAGV
jgi:hypothetical protein